MARELTREDLILGNKKITMVYFTELDGELPLRPLTDGQLAQIEIIKTAGIKIKGDPSKLEQLRDKASSLKGQGVKGLAGDELDMELDIKGITQAEYDANVLAVQYGLAFEGTLTDREVKSMSPPGIVKRIAEEIYKLSTLKQGQVAQLESFRKE